MAVDRDGLIEEEHEEDNALFEEEGLVDLEFETPPHLRELSRAAQIGNVDILRQALGLYPLLLHLLALLFLFLIKPLVLF